MFKFVIFLSFFINTCIFAIVSGEGCNCKSAVSTQANYEKLFIKKNPEENLLLQKAKERKDLDEVYGIAIDLEKNLFFYGLYQEKWTVIKYNSKAEMVFKTSFDIDVFDSIIGVIIDGNCYVYFLGKISEKPFLLKYDFDGKVLWEKQIENFGTFEDLRIPVDSSCYSSLFFSEEADLIP